VRAGARALLVLGVALAASAGLLVPRSARATTATNVPQAFVVLVPGVTLDRLLRIPDIEALARAGGAGWMSPELDASTVRVLTHPISPVGPQTPNQLNATILVAQSRGPRALERTLGILRTDYASVSDRPSMIVVAGTSGSPAMRAANDELRPIVVARGSGDDLFAATGALGTVTSDSTRRTGVVAAADLEATIDAFLDRSTSADAGHPIRVVREPPPFELHERYLAMRRMTVPVQTAAAVWVAIAGVFALVVLWLGRRAPPVLGVIASGAAISVGPLAAALLEAGHLPSPSYATVVPFVVVVAAVVTAIVLLGATRGVLHPVLPLGVLLLLVLLAESAFRWTAALTPFLGGSELNGGRFFGMPNVAIGLLLGASLYAASRLPAVWGFAILVGAALVAGLPSAGANLGAAVTLFAAAGLWLPLRVRGRLAWRELAFAFVVVGVGTVLVLLAHRVSSLPTHVTRFEESEGAGGVWSTFVDRLGVGWRLIERNPFALVPVVGVLATLAVVIRPPAGIAPSLARHPAWRDALLVLLLSSVVAYVANDSGPAACGLGFGMALGGLLYVSVAERTWKMAPA
jgi:hypothetical protein